MAKKLIATIAIKHDNGTTAPGETLDASQFTKEQLEQLYDAGAVRVDSEATTTETETPQTSADQSAEASSPATATPAPAKSTSAPAVKGTTDGKGNAK